MAVWVVLAVDDKVGKKGSAPPPSVVVVVVDVSQTDTGQMMTLSSSMTLTTRKTKYSMNMMKPSNLLMRHLQAAMEMMTNKSMRKRSTMAQKRPLELTCTGLMPLKNDHMSHGNGSLQTHTNTCYAVRPPWRQGSTIFQHVGRFDEFISSCFTSGCKD